MQDNIKKGEFKINVFSDADYSFSTVNCVAIYQDMKFFFLKSIDKSIGINERNRNGRVAIIYMAFFIESLANYICLKHNVTVSKEEKKELHLSPPIIMLQKIYKKIFDRDMELDISGLQDIFFLRNKIIAHVTGTTTKSSNIPELITTYQYQCKVLKDLPKAYADLNHFHAEILYEEMIAILKKYFVLLGDNLPENLGFQIPLV